MFLTRRQPFALQYIEKRIVELVIQSYKVGAKAYVIVYVFILRILVGAIKPCSQ